MPVVAIVGRPNVGKSTLFNRILGKRKAIVEDVSGVTRDRNYGVGTWVDREFVLVDTGGFDPIAETGIFSLIKKQAMLAIEEADIIIFVLDVRTGVTPVDIEVAQVLRKTAKPMMLAVNKCEGKKRTDEVGEFFSLGMEPIFPISAMHGMGVAELLDHLVERIPEQQIDSSEEFDIRVAVLGRPNTGKSTLINRILGEERLLVSEVPGTTADTVDTIVERDGRRYLFVDTAGLRKKSRIKKDVERLTVMRTVSALERCDVCILLLDTTEGVVDQDVKIAGLAQDRGKCMVLGLNKWDLMEKDDKTFDKMTKNMKDKLFFFPHAPVISMSALTGLRVERIFEVVEAVYEQAGVKIATSTLNSALEDAVERHQPSLVRGRRIRFYYTTQVGTHPPTFLIFTNRPGQIRDNYIKYLENRFREEFGFDGTPIRLRFRRGRERRIFA